MAYFLAIMLLTVFGFAIAFYCAFNAELEAFSSIDKAVGSLLFGVLGDGIDFREISNVNRLLAPAIHFLFTFVVSILFFSLFITMVDEAYTQVKEEQAKRQNVHDMARDMLTTRLVIAKNRIKFKMKNLIEYACPGLPKWYKCFCKSCCGAQYEEDEILFLARMRPDIKVKSKRGSKFSATHNTSSRWLFGGGISRMFGLVSTAKKQEPTTGKGNWVKAWQKKRKLEQKQRELILKHAVSNRKMSARLLRRNYSKPSMLFDLSEKSTGSEQNNGNAKHHPKASKYVVEKDYRLAELK
jgi:hypothetical protein